MLGRSVFAAAFLFGALQPIPASADPRETQELVGLWRAERQFGPEIRGRLLLLRKANQIEADIAGFRLPVTRSGDRISFELPGGKGKFRGRLLRSGEIHGFWIQPQGARIRPYASPLVLKPSGSDSWAGVVDPLDDTGTLYLPVVQTAKGGTATFIRDMEANRGIFRQVHRLERQGDTVRLIGNQLGQNKEVVLSEGEYVNRRLVFPIMVPSDGLLNRAYEFEREDTETSDFYPRGNPPRRYHYSRPLARDDGWPTATLEEVGISRPAIERIVQSLIDMPMEAVTDYQIHGLLIARHGELVLEEYFHGFDRDRPHDTRSAAKSWTAVLIGAAMQAGIPIRLDSPVYQTMLGTLPAGLDLRKRKMTLENLLDATSGFDCDERDPSRPVHENIMQDQEEQPDWYRFILDGPLSSAPGEKAIYCSAPPHLAGGMLQRIAGEPLPELFDRLVARPLQMGTYHLQLTPTGTAYGGGGHYFLPRDYMKLPQLMLNGGKWGGKQVLSSEWASKSGAALHDLTPDKQYGYLWNSKEYPYRGRTVRGYFAGGNGGQIFMAIPDLDLVIAFWGGNYSDSARVYLPQNVLIPDQILPAVSDAGMERGK